MQDTALIVEFLDNPIDNNRKVVDHPKLPFARSPLYTRSIVDYAKLTQGDDVKTVYKITLNLPAEYPDFLPGDTIGILPQNDPSLIDELLLRLNLDETATRSCSIVIKKHRSKYKHLPEISTIREILLNYVNIQTPPLKSFIRGSIELTKDRQDIEELQQICNTEYNEFVQSDAGRSLMGFLNAFPSCQPSIDLILQYFPPLLPRIYSIASTLQQHKFDIVFVVVEFDDNRKTKGVCSGYLERQLNQNQTISYYFREPTKFRLPQPIDTPLILIGAGTGLAPFRAFLHVAMAVGRCQKIWLLYGCRYPDRDCLFKDELMDYLENGILTKFDVAGSRLDSGDHPKYVQDCIEKARQEFIDWILEDGAMIFVCGDAKGMVKDVTTTLNNLLISNDEAVSLRMENNNRYIVENWL